MMEDAYATIRTQLAGELLERIAQSSPQFFERLVVDLLVNMGYGGTRKDAGEAVGEGETAASTGSLRKIVWG